MVKASNIWHVSQGRSFPLELRRPGQFQIAVREIKYADLGPLIPAPGEIHVFLIQVERGDLKTVAETIHRAKNLYDFPKVLLLPEGESRLLPVNPDLLPRTTVLEDSILPQHLAAYIEQQLVIEYYRSVVYSLSHEIRKKTEAYEKLLSLSEKELRSLQNESKAYSALMDYHKDHQVFSDQANLARESMEQLQRGELLQLSGQLEAHEKLGQWRDKEIREAYETLEATSTALDLSTQENLEKEKILNAMDRLRNLTEQELQELLQENNELRKKLGMPERYI